MNIDDAGLLRELRKALDQAAAGGYRAQADAMREVLDRLDATMDDVVRVVGEVKRRHARELDGLSRRLAGLADLRAEEQETADAVDGFLRSLSTEG